MIEFGALAHQLGNVSNNTLREKNRQNAYLKLMTKGETSYSKSIKKQRAYNIISNTVWQGSWQHWTFETFVGQFVKAYNDLERFNKPVGPEKQVLDFLKNISHPCLTMQGISYSDL